MNQIEIIEYLKTIYPEWSTITEIADAIGVRYDYNRYGSIRSKLCILRKQGHVENRSRDTVAYYRWIPEGDGQ